MNAFKDMVLDRNIDAGGLFVVEKAVPEFRKDAGFLPRKVPYGVDVSGKKIVFHIHTVENIFRYDDLIRERRFYVVDMLGYLKRVSFSKKQIYAADTGIYRLRKEDTFRVKSDMQDDSKTVEKKTEKSSSGLWFMVASLSFSTAYA